jgi:hypothetical protein
VKLFDWIWKVEGELALPPGLSADEAYARLEPMLREPGTTLERDGERLSYAKKDPVAQDKLAVFEKGELLVEETEGGGVLRWRLSSRALLACFLAPLLFLGFAQLTVAVGKYEKAKAEAAEKADPKAAAAKKKEDEKKDEEVKPLHPVDKFLGAPEPEKPKKDDKKKKKEEENDRFSPTPAYVFAGIFAALYVIGRWLEAWLVRRRFRRQLWGDAAADAPSAAQAMGSGPLA